MYEISPNYLAHTHGKMQYYFLLFTCDLRPRSGPFDGSLANKSANLHTKASPHSTLFDHINHFLEYAFSCGIVITRIFESDTHKYGPLFVWVHDRYGLRDM